MRAIMVTGACHGKVLEMSNIMQQVKVPFLRDEQGWLYIRYRYFFTKGTEAYYIPEGATPEEAFSTLVDLSGSGCKRVTERELYEVACDFRKLDPWQPDYFDRLFKKLKDLLL